MANYVLPTFNLTANVYTGANFANPPRIAITVNLTPGRRGEQPLSPAAGLAATSGAMYILLPPLLDLRGPLNAGGADGLEIPAGSGRQYQVAQVDDIGKGFPNEHRFAVIFPVGVWPTPIP